jgi:hypothetical protein
MQGLVHRFMAQNLLAQIKKSFGFLYEAWVSYHSVDVPRLDLTSFGIRLKLQPF